MRNRIPGHCSDETLIRYLDLELTSVEHESVRRHLGACWRCRTRNAELEQTIHRVAALARADNFPGPGRAEAARGRFLGRATGLTPAPVPISAIRWTGWARAGAVAAAVVLLAGLIGHRAPMPTPGPQPAAAVRQMERAEDASLPKGGVVVQLFQVRLREVVPKPRLRDARLEVWSGEDGRQSGVRWLDTEGRLLRASLTPAVGDADAPLGWTLASRDVSWDAFDTALSAELAGRRGPLLLVSEFRRFCQSAGLKMALEQSGDPSTVVLSAHRQWRGASVRFWIEADGNSWRPLRQGLRIRRGAKEYEIVIEPRGAATVRSFDPGLFARVSIPKAAPKKASPPGELLPTPVAMPAEEPGTDDLEVDVRYALHRALGLARARLHTAPLPGGQVLVKGVVPSAERREELAAALAAAGLWARINWQVEVEPPIPARPAPPLAGSPLALSGALYDEAWALAQLAERYDGEAAKRLSGRSTRLLKIMIQDRLDGAASRAKQLAERLGVPAESAAPAAAGGEDWRQLAFALFRLASEANAAIEDGQKSGPALAALASFRVLAEQAGAAAGTALRDRSDLASEKGRP